MMASIEEEYQRDKKLRKQDVLSLMEWLQTQPHLPQTSEQNVLWFLKSCYYNNEFAKRTLDLFYSFRTREYDLLGLRTEEGYKKVLNVGLMAPLSKKTHEDHTVFLVKLIDPNPENLDFAECVNMADTVVMTGLNSRGTHEGMRVVIDMSNFCLGHLPKINVMIVKKALIYIQRAIPIRLKGVHFIHINNKTFLDMLLALAKPFMEKSLIDMLNLHSDLKDLEKFVPLECLPTDYGGQEKSVAALQEEVLNRILDNIKFIEYLVKQKVDETKRPADSKLPPEVFGTSGTFKKLELD